MNYKELADMAITLLKQLENGEIKASTEVKEMVNLIGKTTNIYKSTLAYKEAKHKIDSAIEFFEEK